MYLHVCNFSNLLYVFIAYMRIFHIWCKLFLKFVICLLRSRHVYNSVYYICLHRDRDGSLSAWFRRLVRPPWNNPRKHPDRRVFGRGWTRGWWQPVSQWYWWWRCRNYGRNACGRWHPRGIWNSITCLNRIWKTYVCQTCSNIYIISGFRIEELKT